MCLEISRYINRRGSIPNDTFTLIETLVKAGSNFNPKNHVQHKFIKQALIRASGTFPTMLAIKFEHVLSATSIKKIKSLLPKDDHDDLRFYLNKLSQRVHSMKFLSRIAIRKELKGKVLVKVEELPLPSSLKGYLLLEEE